MLHRRTRHLEPLLKKLLKMSPLVGVLGHRQVGKTTLLELLSPHYHTLDDSSELFLAQQTPKKYLQDRGAGHLVAIDECQLAPELFPALKEWVRTHPRPGQFLLSGSVRFTSRKAIQESLTGRIVNLELFPMLLSELKEENLPDFWKKTVSLDNFPRQETHTLNLKQKKTEVEKYFQVGGLPGICFIRDEIFRNRKLDSHLETILDRDLRKLVETDISYPQLRKMLQVIADLQGEIFSWTEIKKQTEISIPTLKKLFYGLEGVFLIRTILVEGDSKGPVYYFEDLGEHAFVRSKSLTMKEKMIHFLMVHVRGELSYGLSVPFRIFQYRTRAGVCVPLCIHVKQDYLGVVPIESEYPSRGEMAAGESFLKRYNRSKVLFIHSGTRVTYIDERRLIIPLVATL